MSIIESDSITTNEPKLLSFKEYLKFDNAINQLNLLQINYEIDYKRSTFKVNY